MHIMKYSTPQMLSPTHIGSLSLISLMDSYSVSFPSSIDKCLSFTYTLKCWRIVAQRLAHLVRDQGVGGSNPPCPKRGHWLFVVVQLNRGNPLYLHLKCRFSGVFLWCLYNSSRKSLWCKTAVRQSEHQSCQNLQYDRDIHGNYSTVGVPLLSRMMLMTHPRFQDVPAQFEIIHFSIWHF